MSPSGKARILKKCIYIGGSPFLNVKRGRRDDLGGLFLRSAWEANFARYLNYLVEQKQILHWDYEPETFWFDGIKTGARFYTPDFKVLHKDNSIEYFEVKGYMNSVSKTKLKRMKKYHPSVKISLIDTKVYKALCRMMSHLPHWEK